MSGGAWGWAALFLLGAYHGINPGMGWLFAVALGMQEKSTRAVVRSLAPIALGHALAIAIVVLLAALVQMMVPLESVKIAVGLTLLSLGAFKFYRSRHFRWGGMQVGFRDLTAWSFLVASAHGAGLMVLPLVMASPAVHADAHSLHQPASHDPLMAVWVTLVHTLGYLTLTAALALLVYKKFGLSLLRKAWLNLDLLWAAALVASGLLALAL